MATPQLPTLGHLVDAARRTTLRFPLVLVSAVVTTWAGLGIVESSGDDEQYLRLMAAASLGLPLFFALTMFAERRIPDVRLRWALFAAGAATLALVWTFWGSWSEDIQAIRYIQLSAVLHLLAAFLPYAGLGESNGFWYYNKALFLRFLTSGLYSAVFFAGLAVAFAALDQLFGLEIPEEGYFRLWMVMAFVVTTWLFVGGVPQDLASLESQSDYPSGLRVFTQYVLLPIVVLYLVILTLYFTKILVTREWPSGWVGWLVSSVAVVGIFAWLLVRPLEDLTEHAWVKSYTRGFYLAIMPAIVMLWFAIGQRIGQYGVTEPRYFLTVMSLWLAGVALYYTLRRTRDIKLIPASLCLVGVVTFAGPWGAYSVSLRSQTGRLEALLTAHGLLSEGRVQPAAREIPLADRRQISAVLEYLMDTHGATGLPTWIGDSLIRLAGGGGSRERSVRRIMDSWGVKYVARWNTEQSREAFWFYGKIQEPVPIAGYEFALELDDRILRDSLRLTETAFLAYDRETERLLLKQAGQTLLGMSLRPLIDRALERDVNFEGRRWRQEPAFRIEARSGGSAMLTLFTLMEGQTAGDTLSLTAMRARVYLSLP